MDLPSNTATPLALFTRLELLCFRSCIRQQTKYCEIFGTSSYGEGRSASPPYERVPNISQYKFNNLFIIYFLH